VLRINTPARMQRNRNEKADEKCSFYAVNCRCMTAPDVAARADGNGGITNCK